MHKAFLALNNIPLTCHFLSLGLRLHGETFQKIKVQNEIEYIVYCFKEPCCLSINHRRKISQGRWSLCEILLSVFNDRNSSNLKENRFYDCIFFNSPIKARTNLKTFFCNSINISVLIETLWDVNHRIEMKLYTIYTKYEWKIFEYCYHKNATKLLQKASA